MLADGPLHDLIPERHRVDDAVGLGGRDEPTTASLRHAGCVARDAFDAGTRENGLLHSHLPRRSLAESTSYFRIFALDVLAYNDDVEPLETGHRTFDARQKPHRAQVDVLIERAPDRDEQTPERDIVGNLGSTDRTEQERVTGVEGFESVERHHPSGAPIMIRAPVTNAPLSGEGMPLGDRIDTSHRRGGYFHA